MTFEPHYIYCYYLGETPVYVGATSNPVQRDYQHRHSSLRKFAKFVRAQGPAKFEFRLIEKLEQREDEPDFLRRVYEREAFWMSELETHYTYGKGGQNFDRNGERQSRESVRKGKILKQMQALEAQR